MYPEERDRHLPEERDNRPGRVEQTLFQAHGATYVIVNVMLIAIWAVVDFGGYFWPIWPMIGWGPAVAIHAWVTYGRPR